MGGEEGVEKVRGRKRVVEVVGRWGIVDGENVKQGSTVGCSSRWV